VLVHSNQNRKLAIWGAMEVNVQSAKGTKTLDPRAGKKPIGARSYAWF